MNKKLMYSVFLVGLVLSLGFTGCSSGAVTANAAAAKYFNEANGVVSQGTIEAKEVSINARIPGRIAKINVEEGQEVKAGDVLVEIESDDIQAKKDQAEALLKQAQAGADAAKKQEETAEAGLEVAKAREATAKAGYDAAVGQETAAKAQSDKAENGARTQEIAQVQATYDLWEKTFERVQKLYDKGAVSTQKLDEVKTQLEVVKQQLSMAKEGARTEDKGAAVALAQQAQAGVQVRAGEVSQAQAGVQAALSTLQQAQVGVQAAQEKVEQAEAGIREVDSYLKDTKITAPNDGVVTAINSHQGELVSTGMSIATVSDIKNAWVEVKVKETDLEKITVGKEVDVKVPTYSEKLFKGKVVRINQKPDFATKRSTNDNGDFDILSFGVKIELDDKDKVLRPGMTAFVQFKK